MLCEKHCLSNSYIYLDFCFYFCWFRICVKETYGGVFFFVIIRWKWVVAIINVGPIILIVVMCYYTSSHLYCDKFGAYEYLVRMFHSLVVAFLLFGFSSVYGLPMCKYILIDRSINLRVLRLRHHQI